MKKLFTLIILLASTATFAQNYFPLIRPNLVWQVMQGDGTLICHLSGGQQFYFQGDTLVSGFTYQKIYFNPIISLIGNPYCPPFAVDGNSTSNYGGSMREDTIARKVFIYDYSTNSDELLYDFNLVAGDTLNSNFAGMGSVLIVDSVSTTTLPNGGVRKIFYLNSGENYIESIGGSQGIQFPLIQGLGFWKVPICISENNIPIWGGCFGTVGINENLKESKMVYPNPFVNEISFKASNAEETEIILYNSISNEILQKSFSNSTTINTENFESGIYVYKMINKSGLSSFGKLVKL
ncbi:MAG: T9SS type A sorting domain-containing protein [Bacteroidetes bacterium]|nr:T9SS type A sorting domain-containing protein [Bacteroidota bacterium]